MSKNKKDILSRSISITMAGFMLLSSTVSSFAGHKNYFLKTSMDFGGFGLLYDVIYDDGGGDKFSEYEEEKGGYYYSPVKHYVNIGKNGYSTISNNKGEHLNVNFLANRNTVEKEEKSKSVANSNARVATGPGGDFLPTEQEKKEEEAVSVVQTRYEKLVNLDDDKKNDSLVFSFPGMKGVSNNAMSADYARANLIGETLITGLNQAILFINNNCRNNLVSKNSLMWLVAKLSYTSELGNGKGNRDSYTFAVGNPATYVKVERMTESKAMKNGKPELIPVNGLDYNDYVKIICATDSKFKNNVSYSYFPWKMEKGYHNEKLLYKNLTNEGKKQLKGENGEPEYLSWGQLILQAMVNHDTQGTAEQDFASDSQTIIGQGLGSDLSRTVGSIRSMLGLSSMSELVLNMGARPSNYHMGVMTLEMHNVALTIYTLNLIISLSFVAFMIIKLIHQKMLSTTNIIAKTSLMEGIKDIAFVAVMLGFFAPLFEILLELNYLIVRTFSYSSDFMTQFSLMGNTALSMESMAGFVISTMFLSIDMYINFVYLIREITVSFLFAIAPIIIVSYLWSQTQKNMVFSYFRELVGNIFMQSFHAITMTFFSAYNLENMSSLQAMASAYCFIPITQLFRQLVIGNGGGFTEKVGGKLAGQVATMTAGMKSASLSTKQSKEMVEAQANASKTSALWSAGGNILGAGVATLGTALGQPIIGGAVASAISGSMSAIGTMEGQKEIGKTQAKHAEESMGMGLAEMGLGLGVSAYDSAGSGLVSSGLKTFKEGAKIKGQADARYNPNNAFGYGDATQALGMASFYEDGGRMMARGVSDQVRESTAEMKMVRDMKHKDNATVKYYEKHGDEHIANERKRLEFSNRMKEELSPELAKGKVIDSTISLNANIQGFDVNKDKRKEYSMLQGKENTEFKIDFNNANPRLAIELLKSNQGINMVGMSEFKRENAEALMEQAVLDKARSVVADTKAKSSQPNIFMNNAMITKSQNLDADIAHKNANPDKYIESKAIDKYLSAKANIEANNNNYSTMVASKSSDYKVSNALAFSQAVFNQGIKDRVTAQKENQDDSI